jgi:hypothetical protein
MNRPSRLPIDCLLCSCAPWMLSAREANGESSCWTKPTPHDREGGWTASQEQALHC